MTEEEYIVVHSNVSSEVVTDTSFGLLGNIDVRNGLFELCGGNHDTGG